MVIRAILRNVQNALVLSSALLVILALQRLQHYEFRSEAIVFEEQQHHRDRSQQDDEVHESLDDFRLGMNMNRHMRFEAPFHVRLFQYMFPKLPTLEGIISKDQSALRQDWEITEIHTLIHYLVDISGHGSDCQSLDAAAILAHSLTAGPKNVLHAIVNDTLLWHCNTSSWLSTVGYNIIPSGSITLLPGCSELWQAYALQNLTHVDVLVRVPATTIFKNDAVSSVVTKNDKLVSNPSMGNIRKRRRALSASTYSSRHTVQLLRPKSAAAAHTNDCQATTPITVCQSSPSHCRIMRDLFLIIPSRKCPLPWTCPNITATGVTSCRFYHDLWREQRRDLRKGNDADFCANGKYHSIHEQMMMSTMSESSIL